KEKMTRKLGYFEDSGTDKKKYALILAAYYDRTETAKKLIQSDPDQINRQDPHSGLTALHIAVFRQNIELVEILTKHPRTDLSLKDVFGRRIVDMLEYTTNQELFTLVIDATYPDLMRDLESDDADENNVVTLRPPEP
ncbi:MAG: ankyrin repeat domain-containing protein, partial [Pseudomonadota bacterium]